MYFPMTGTAAADCVRNVLAGDTFHEPTPLLPSICDRFVRVLKRYGHVPPAEGRFLLTATERIF